MNEEHLLAYYRWDDRMHWKLDSIERSKHGAPAYVSYDKTLFNTYALPGNVLWVIGLAPDGTPTLEARIAIARRFGEGDEGVTVEGMPEGSSFYGLNDASSAIMRLAFVSERQKWSLREREGSTNWVPGHGTHLGAPRRIAHEGEKTDQGYVSPGIRPLNQLAKLALNRSIFISWKHKDNNASRQRFLRDLTVALTKQGYSVWFDQLALGGAEQVEERKNKRQLMKQLLRQGLETCKLVLGVWTEAYGEPSTEKGENWTKGEWQDFENVKRVALIPGGKFVEKSVLVDPDARVPMPQKPSTGDVTRVAKEIADKCGSLL